MDIPLRGLRMAIIPCADLRDKAYPCHLGIGEGLNFTGGLPGAVPAAAVCGPRPPVGALSFVNAGWWWWRTPLR
jgi:hypothetical protein